GPGAFHVRVVGEVVVAIERAGGPEQRRVDAGALGLVGQRRRSGGVFAILGLNRVACVQRVQACVRGAPGDQADGEVVFERVQATGGDVVVGALVPVGIEQSAGAQELGDRIGRRGRRRRWRQRAGTSGLRVLGRRLPGRLHGQAAL